MMKLHEFAKSVIFLILVFTALTQANLLTNGDFEDGDTGQIGSITIPGWSHWGSNGWHNDDTGAVIDTKGMKFWWDQVGMWQDFSATAGVTYAYSVECMDFSGATSANNWDFQIEAEFYDDTNADIVKVVLDQFDSTIQPDDTWVQIGGSIMAPVNTAYGRVVMRTVDWQEGIEGSIYFDNVSVIPNNDPDYNDDFDVDFTDYLYLSESWQQTAPQYDLSGDDIINIQDLKDFAQNWLTEQTPAGSITIAIDPTTTFQEIEGFGASLTDSSAWLIYEFLNASERLEVLTDLFDPDEGIGLSYLRQPMGTSDFRVDSDDGGHNDYTYDDMPSGQTDYDLSEFTIEYDEDYIIPTLKEILAINPDVRIMGSPWSAPHWMKNGEQLGSGTLKSDVYEEYALYFVKYIQAYAALPHGLNIDAITLQNEPYYEPGSYHGMRMEPADQIKLVKEMGPLFAANGIDTKILVWDHNWDNTSFPLAVLSDSQARPYIDGVAWHHYGGNVSAQTTVHNAYPDKGAYFTEGSDGTWNDDGFDSDLIRNGIFMVETIQNWAKTVIKWNLALDQNNGPKIAGGCDTCYGVVTINQSNRQVSSRPHYYALGHASKFLRPGAVRIASGSDSDKAVAFKNTDGSIVLYTVNPNASVSPLKIEWNSDRIITRMPARSIMTFRWDNVPNATVDVYLTTGDQSKLLSKEADLLFGN